MSWDSNTYCKSLMCNELGCVVGKDINNVGKSGVKWTKVVKKYYFYDQTH